MSDFEETNSLIESVLRLTIETNGVTALASQVDS
jgi:hypothetical protein